MLKLFDNFKNSPFYNLNKTSRMIFINVSRGCPNACNFCSIFNKKWRCRSPPEIVDEIEMLQERYNADSFYLIGDNLNYMPKWLKSLCDELIERKIDISYVAVSACAKKKNISKSLIDGLARSGCISISYSFESGSQEMLNSLNKKLKINDFDEIIRYTKKKGIQISASFILGAPGESDLTLNKTIEFITRYDFDRVGASILAPLPGTILYEEMLNIMPELRRMDKIPMDDVKRAYAHNYCEISYERLQDFCDEISKRIKQYDLY
jgi:radical SAM superfamily enzyme YgiQ (UPF0313 family)